MKDERKKVSKTKVVAYRRACKKSADGTGLSHYIFAENGTAKGKR